MEKHIEVCQILGHDNHYSSHICTYHYCMMEYKLLCQICLNRKSHKHQQKTFNHIITIEQYIAMNNIINKQQLCLQFQKQLYKYDLDKIQTMKLSQYYEYKQHEKITFIEISNSQQNLALGKDYQHLTIINMETKKESKSFKLKNQFKECKFSRNSKYLYLLDYNYRLYSYQLNTQKLAFIRKIPKQVLSFLTPTNHGVMCCSNNKIFIINMKQYKQVQSIKLQCNNECRVLDINAFDYDNYNDVIITGSWTDNTISILNRWNGQMLIQQSIQIYYFLTKFLIQNDDALYVCNKYQIVKCHIDYNNRIITQLCSFYDIHYQKISFFNYIEEFDIIIIINQYKVLILDRNLKQLQIILHDTGLNISDFFLQVQNLQALKYIIIPLVNQFKVYTISQQLLQEEQNLIIQGQE